jgi:ABC-type sugar transport system ATPase subunit
MSPVISVLNVIKNFLGVLALSRARFQLLAGEVHALVGDNSAGKSRLVKSSPASIAGTAEKFFITARR